MNKNPPPTRPDNPFADRDRIRYEVAAPFLKGCGLEIGAGIYPQRLLADAKCLNYDLRGAEELGRLFGSEIHSEVRSLESIGQDFPEGADFLIAHNVLEHTADPIGTLIAWHGYVRDGGTVVLSLPDKNACPDNKRLEPPIGHLIYDYLLGRDAHAFESREHILSNCLGWITDYGDLAAHGVNYASDGLLSMLFERNVDTHWHAFTQSLTEKTVLAACVFGDHRAEILAKADFTTTHPRTVGDIILVYRLWKGAGTGRGFEYSITPELRRAREDLRLALARVEACPPPDGKVLDLEGTPELFPGNGVYPAWIDRSDRPEFIDLDPPFVREQGHCFMKSGLIAREPGDTMENPAQSRFQLLENGVALGPAHSLHQRVRDTGAGSYSHWRDSLYFSASDNSDPNFNGKRYRLVLG